MDLSSVLLHEILKIDGEEEVFLAEESLADLIRLPVTSEILRSGPKAKELIEVVEEKAGSDRLGVALKLTEPAEIWLLLTDRYSASGALDALLQNNASRIVQAEEGRFLEGVVEALAISLKEELFCDGCPVASPPLFVPERIDGLERFLRPLLPSRSEVLEICCGSGMGTQALKRLGLRPWTEDVDSCEICMALKAEYLEPDRAMVLDARLLDRFFPPRRFDAVVGFMVGLIDDVNWPLWREILISSAMLARDLVIYTTYTEREARIVAEALRSVGWSAEVAANPDDLGIYDQWAAIGRRGG